jgi:hypothetical protein
VAHELIRKRNSAELEMFYQLSVEEAVKVMWRSLDDGKRKGRGVGEAFQGLSSEDERPGSGVGERWGADPKESPKASWFGVVIGIGKGER